MTALLVFNSGCAVKIRDSQFCSPIPNHLGAVCDNFLSSNQLILNEEDWEALQEKWVKEGQAVECTQASTIGNLKAEIEKLCSLAPCDYQLQKEVVNGLEKIQALGQSPAPKNASP